MLGGVVVAGVVAVVLLAVPVVLAVANARGWIPDRFWNPDATRETWLDRRPWIASLIMGAVYGGTAIAYFVAGDTTMMWMHVFNAVLWSMLPFAWTRARRRARDEAQQRNYRDAAASSDD